INEEIYLLGGRATQIIDWDNNHKYCGKCGAETIYSQTEKGAKLCPECGFTSFTRISPAIITSIIKEEVNQEGKVENKLLMARHSYYENIRYSLIAGFMEAGETIEEALKREVKEEVGINVKDLEYFGSQSWPFPNSLMIGIICKYDSGEIKVDGNEITKAKWFKKEDIEFDGYQLSIAYKLIQNFIDNY
ncbi:MAG: NAD(+) diphosphatase, partial [Methanobrevibacter sp.]|nr:NAD(+) diphosphatase [Methanobrevibacter sp.]